MTNNTTMTVTPLSRRIGARIDGVDLRDLDDETFAEIDHALLEYQVVFLRGQDLTTEQQSAFAARWGTLSVFPIAKVFGGDATISVIEDTEDDPPNADGWHTDVTWIAEPPRLAVLYADLIPDSGGDTMWSSLYAAYDALSPTMAAMCEGLSVRHHRGGEFDRIAAELMGPEMFAALAETYPPVEHPLVRTHPITGRRALFLSGGFMDQIVGLHPDESAALLAHLQTHIDDPNNQVRWVWQSGDVAVWDEACTNHRALSDHFPQHRRMRRCTVDGGRPFFAAERDAVQA
jgi:taurine dioxygenase